MKQFTTPTAPSGSGQPPARPSGAAPIARVAFPVVDFAQGSRSTQTSLLEEHPSLAVFGTTYQEITDLPSPSVVTRHPVFAPHNDPIPAPDPSTGVRHYASRDYVDIEDGTTVRVTYDPATGECRERQSDTRMTHGLLLHRIAQSGTWRSSSSASGSSASSSPSISHSSSASSLSHSLSSSSLSQSASSSSLQRSISGASISSATRIDPHWNLSLYTLSVSTQPMGGHAPPGYKSLVIGNERYCIDAKYGGPTGQVSGADNKIFSVQSNGSKTEVGLVTSDGLFLVNGRHYLPVETDFCLIDFDSEKGYWKIAGRQVNALPDIYIEMGSAPGKWVPAMAVDNLSALFQSAWKIKGYTGSVGQIDLVGNSNQKRVYRYMQGYLRQIIGACEPTILRAPVALKGKLIDDYIWKHGYPYDLLRSIHTALESGQAIPPGLPAFDAFQGLSTVTCSKDGNFSLGRIEAMQQFCYPDRLRSPQEQAILAEWKTCIAPKDNRKKGALNERMYEARLTEDGYRLLEGGTYGGGQNGFDRVFEGPAGNIYILEAKHVRKIPSGTLGNASMGWINEARQMSDKWVCKVLASADPGTPAHRAVSEAMRWGQLFKLLGTTTEEGKLIMFKIDMSPMEF